jgi:hypothetical protein
MLLFTKNWSSETLRYLYVVTYYTAIMHHSSIIARVKLIQLLPHANPATTAISMQTTVGRIHRAYHILRMRYRLPPLQTANTGENIIMILDRRASAWSSVTRCYTSVQLYTMYTIVASGVWLLRINARRDVNRRTLVMPSTALPPQSRDAENSMIQCWRKGIRKRAQHAIYVTVGRLQAHRDALLLAIILIPVRASNRDRNHQII